MKIYVRATTSNGWEEGTLNIEGHEIRYVAKVFDLGSKYGIDDGRISKLQMIMNGKTIISYDRGWDIEPKGRIAQKALKKILEIYPCDGYYDESEDENDYTDQKQQIAYDLYCNLLYLSSLPDLYNGSEEWSEFLGGSRNIQRLFDKKTDCVRDPDKVADIAELVLDNIPIEIWEADGVDYLIDVMEERLHNYDSY